MTDALKRVLHMAKMSVVAEHLAATNEGLAEARAKQLADLEEVEDTAGILRDGEKRLHDAVAISLSVFMTNDAGIDACVEIKGLRKLSRQALAGLVDGEYLPEQLDKLGGMKLGGKARLMTDDEVKDYLKRQKEEEEEEAEEEF